MLSFNTKKIGTKTLLSICEQGSSCYEALVMYDGDMLGLTAEVSRSINDGGLEAPDMNAKYSIVDRKGVDKFALYLTTSEGCYRVYEMDKSDLMKLSSALKGWAR